MSGDTSSQTVAASRSSTVLPRLAVSARHIRAPSTTGGAGTGAASVSHPDLPSAHPEQRAGPDLRAACAALQRAGGEAAGLPDRRGRGGARVGGGGPSGGTRGATGGSCESGGSDMTLK